MKVDEFVEDAKEELAYIFMINKVSDNTKIFLEQALSIIERQRAALETIANLCADLDDYAPVSIEIGMIARKALEEV